jgi:hypothetical protein
MILGLSVPAFTLLHVIISLVAIGAGLVALLGMANDNRLPGWTALFLLTTALTSITGFFFHSKAFGPPHAFGVITLVVMIPTLLGLTSTTCAAGGADLRARRGAGVLAERRVGIIQFFQKVEFLRALAPTQSEPPFLVAQIVLLVVVALLVLVAAIRFRPMATVRLA